MIIDFSIYEDLLGYATHATHAARWNGATRRLVVVDVNTRETEWFANVHTESDARKTILGTFPRETRGAVHVERIS